MPLVCHDAPKLGSCDMNNVPAINPLSLAPFAGNPALGLDTDIPQASRNAIERLIFTYSYNWDSRSPEATASLFTETANVAFFLDGATKPMDRSLDRESLLQSMTLRTDMLKRWQVETRHLMTNTVFGPAEDNQVQAMTTAVIFWQQLPDHPAPTAVQTGYYKSWCVETDKGWLFQRRETHMSGIFHPKHLFKKPT